MWSWFTEQSFWVRMSFALALLAVSAIILFAANRIWFFGWGAGFVLFLVALAGSGGKKRDYNF